MWGTFRPYRWEIIVTNQSFSKALQRVDVGCDGRQVRRRPLTRALNPFLSCKGCVPAIQLFEPSSQLHPAWQASHTVLTVSAVDSQEGQHMTDYPRSQHHGTPVGQSFFPSLAFRSSRRPKRQRKSSRRQIDRSCLPTIQDCSRKHQAPIGQVLK